MIAAQHSAFQTGHRPSAHGTGEVVSSVFTSHRVIVQQHCSEWVESLRWRLDELTSLPVGWDGYLGQPVSFQCANFVVNMLERLCRERVPAPSLVPGSDGSIQVEWHRKGFDVELDVLGPQNVVATRVDRRKPEEEQVIFIQNDFSEIALWVDELVD